MGGHLNDFDFLCKIVVIGNSSVGKTNLVARYAHSEFDSNAKATIGVAFASRSHLVGTKVVKTHVWDTAGQEKYRAITSAFYRGALGALVVYDITQMKSFEDIDRWVTDLKAIAGDNVAITVVGNKVDLCQSSRVVPFEMAKEYCDQHKFSFVETSALQNTNVQYAFENTIQRAIPAVIQAKPTQSDLKVSLRPSPLLNKKSFCCRQ